jgi:3'-phosphoadenosine 5'-phosphosulfate sulfotransferase (PAPS reductase)/FAD synthetase
MKVTREELQRRLALPLGEKILWAREVIVEYFAQFNGQVYVSFSGGKDSQVLLHIVRDLFPNVPAVFCDTGLEYPEIRKHVKTFDNVVWMKPRMKFPEVVKNVGVAVGSKKVAMMIRRLRDYITNPLPRNEATRNLYMNGLKKDGTISKGSKLPERFKPLLNAPFKTSDKCCDIFKKEPFKRYENETGRKPITGTMVCESDQRMTSYLKTGCNSFDTGKEMCRPFSIWTESDVWKYAELHNIRFAEVYYDRVVDGVILKGENRTGCMFCLFGIHLEKGQNRFQRMRWSHPRQYKFCIEDLGIGKVLDFIGVRYA